MYIFLVQKNNAHGPIWPNFHSPYRKRQILSVKCLYFPICNSKNVSKNIASVYMSMLFSYLKFSTCFGFSKALSHQDGSFEHQQPMFLMKLNEIIILILTI